MIEHGSNKDKSAISVLTWLSEGRAIIDADKTAMFIYHARPGIVNHDMELDFFLKSFGVRDDLQIVFFNHRGNGQSDDGDEVLWMIKPCGQDI